MHIALAVHNSYCFFVVNIVKGQSSQEKITSKQKEPKGLYNGYDESMCYR